MAAGRLPVQVTENAAGLAELPLFLPMEAETSTPYDEQAWSLRKLEKTFALEISRHIKFGEEHGSFKPPRGLAVMALLFAEIGL